MRIQFSVATAVLIVLLLSVSSCALLHERYQSRRSSHYNGYGDVPLGPDRYGVFYYFAQGTPTDTGIAYFLYRCAELTLQADYTHFRLLDMTIEDVRNVVGITPVTAEIRENLGIWRPLSNSARAVWGSGAKWDLDPFDLTRLREWRDIVIGAISVQQVTDLESTESDWFDAREVAESLGPRIRWCSNQAWPECYDRDY